MRPESPWYNREEKHGLSIMSSIYSCPMCFHSSRELPSFMPWNATLLQQILVYDFSTFRVQFSSVTQSCLTLCDPMDFSMPGFPVHHQHPELAQTHIYRVGDAIQPSRPLLSLCLAFSLSQHQGLFQWVSFSHQVAKVLELQLQHQSFQWIFITDWIFIGGEWMHANA